MAAKSKSKRSRLSYEARLLAEARRNRWSHITLTRSHAGEMLATNRTGWRIQVELPSMTVEQACEFAESLEDYGSADEITVRLRQRESPAKTEARRERRRLKLLEKLGSYRQVGRVGYYPGVSENW